MPPTTAHPPAQALERPVHIGSHSTSSRHRSRLAVMLVGTIHGYQMARAGRPTGCRYLPTCSEFAVEAIESHGPVRGTALAARRLARCNPWGGHGIDPVPDRKDP